MKLRGLRMAAAGLAAGGMALAGLGYGGALADGGGDSAPQPPIDMLPAYSGGVVMFNPPPPPCPAQCVTDDAVVDQDALEPVMQLWWLPDSPANPGADDVSGAQPPGVGRT